MCENWQYRYISKPKSAGCYCCTKNRTKNSGHVMKFGDNISEMFAEMNNVDSHFYQSSYVVSSVTLYCVPPIQKFTSAPSMTRMRLHVFKSLNEIFLADYSLCRTYMIAEFRNVIYAFHYCPHNTPACECELYAVYKQDVPHSEIDSTVGKLSSKYTISYITHGVM